MNLDPLQYFKRKAREKGAQQALASNQNTAGGASAQAASPQALPNLDPGKMSYLDEMAKPMSAAPGGDPKEVELGSATGAYAGDERQFAQARDRASRRAAGERSSAEVGVDSLDADQARYQAEADASRRLASQGFAPASALGLEYAKSTDRMVAELMDRRRAEREARGQQDLLSLFSMGEQRRSDRAAGARQLRGQDMQDSQYRLGEQNRQVNFQQSLAEQQRQFEAEGQRKKREQEWWRPENWTAEGVGKVAGAGMAAATGNYPLAAATLAGTASSGKKRRRP